MRTTAPEPSAYACQQLDEIAACGYSVRVMALSAEGSMLVLVEGESSVLIADRPSATREQLAGQVFIMCERPSSSDRFVRLH